jgi:uncharacterized membrane protein (DUF485 family)
VSDSLRRNIPSSDRRRRYGDWELIDDRVESSPPAVPEWRRDEPSHPEYEAEVRRLMLRQRRLSLVAAVVLFGTVFAFTIGSYAFSDLLNRPVWHGFSPAIFFAAVAVYPITWLIAVVYTIISNRMDGLG